MNRQEFTVTFDILYNNISSGQAPGLNDYEKSVYLTLAQDELVKTTYSGFNITREAVEETEKRRKQLAQLISDVQLASDAIITTTSTLMLPDALYSYVYRIPDNLLFTLYESVRFVNDSNTDCHYAGKSAGVMTINHNEITRSLNNPFRQPNHRKVWRVDYEGGLDNNIDRKEKIHEIISKEDIDIYQIRYLKKPTPIILTDLTTEPYYEVGLNIDGETAPWEVDECCELNEVFHPEIIKRAVELAIRDYSEKSLQAVMQTNQRVE